MSTDTYIDFISEQLHTISYQDSWHAWINQLNILESKDGRRKHYDPVRVAHVSWLLSDENFSDWEAFEQKYNDVLVSLNMIENVASDWTVMYNRALLRLQMSSARWARTLRRSTPNFELDLVQPNSPDFMFDANTIRHILMNHMGHYMSLRTD